MDSAILVGVLIGIVILWKLIAYIRSVWKGDQPRLPTSRQAHEQRPLQRHGPRIGARRGDPKINIYGELED